MQSRWLLLPAASLALVFTSCVNHGGGSTAGTNPRGLGPFDSRGNYVEAWADSPSQWSKGASTQVADAQPDRAAATDVPVSPEFVKVETVPYQETSTPVVYKKPSVTKSVETTRSVETTKPKPRTTELASNTIKPKPVVKKPVAKKPVAKAKPKSTRHAVKSGDNLYNIAKRYGTSVSAIQKANGVKGSSIRPGQSLVIPR